MGAVCVQAPFPQAQSSSPPWVAPCRPHASCLTQTPEGRAAPGASSVGLSHSIGGAFPVSGSQASHCCRKRFQSCRENPVCDLVQAFSRERVVEGGSASGQHKAAGGARGRGAELHRVSFPQQGSGQMCQGGASKYRNSCFLPCSYL